MNVNSFVCVCVAFFICIQLCLSVPVSHNNKPEKKIKRTRRRPSGRDSTCFGAVPICNSTSAYPENQINKLMLRYKKKFSPIFGTVIQPAEGTATRMLFKSAEVVDEGNLCRTRTVTVTPKTAYDINSNKRYIVNTKEHVQTLSFETCAERNCLGGSVQLFGFETFCEQIYNTVRLLYLDDEKRSLEYGQFSIPSSCSCSYKRTKLQLL